MFEGFPITASDILSPDFYRIEDFYNAQETSSPVWLNVYMLEGRFIAHPTVIEKLKQNAIKGIVL